MKYKTIIASVFTMLLFFNIFVSASVTNEKTTENEVANGIDECIVVITEPECYYIYFQYGEDTPPIKGNTWPLLESLNLIIYISLYCQLYVEYYLDCPDAAKVKFSTKIWLTGEEFIEWENAPSEGFNNIFLDLPCSFGIYNIRVDVYDVDGNWLAGDELDCLVAFLPISS